MSVSIKKIFISLLCVLLLSLPLWASADAEGNYLVHSDAELELLLKQQAVSQPTSYTIQYTNSYDLYTNHYSFSKTVYSFAVKSFDWEWNRSSQTVTLKNIVYYSPCIMVCENENAFIQQFEQAIRQGKNHFALICPDDLRRKFYSSDNLLHECAGRNSAEVELSFSSGYNKYGYVIVKNATRYNVPYLETLEEAGRYLYSCAQRVDKEIIMFCSPEVYNQIFEGDIWSGLTLSCGILHPNGKFIKANYRIKVTPDYYPGWKIFNLHRNGQLRNLSPREVIAYQEAKALAQQACQYSALPLQQAKFIHDALADRITYTKATKDDYNTAIGALVDGKADCDGYADAFYLTASFAGLDVMYMYGRSADNPSSDDSAHAWNLLKLNGQWRIVDVTWGDNDETGNHEYIYFNLGKRLASKAYIWPNIPVLPQISYDNEPSYRTTKEYIIYDFSDISNVIKTAASKNSAFTLYLVNSTSARRDYYTYIEPVLQNMNFAYYCIWGNDGLQYIQVLINPKKEPDLPHPFLNLLSNSNFKAPNNANGKKAYKGKVTTINQWRGTTENVKITLNNSGINIDNRASLSATGHMAQHLKNLPDGMYTLCAETSNGTLQRNFTLYNGVITNVFVKNANDAFTGISYSRSNDRLTVQIGVHPGKVVTVYRAALYRRLYSATSLPAYNLLKNSDFKTPANTNGKTAYTGKAHVYTIDSWRTTTANVKIAINKSGINIDNRTSHSTNGHMSQKVKGIGNGKYTLCVQTSEGLLLRTITINNGQLISQNFINTKHAFTGVAYDQDTRVLTVQIGVQPKNVVTVYGAALYNGVYTKDTLPINAPAR